MQPYQPGWNYSFPAHEYGLPPGSMLTNHDLKYCPGQLARDVLPPVPERRQPLLPQHMAAFFRAQAEAPDLPHMPNRLHRVSRFNVHRFFHFSSARALAFPLKFSSPRILPSPTAF